MDQDRRTYVKPEMVKIENIKDITFECPDFACSVTIPPWTGSTTG